MARNGIPPSDLGNMTIYEAGLILESVTDYEFVMNYEANYKYLSVVCTITNQNLKKQDKISPDDYVDHKNKERYDLITKGEEKLSHDDKVSLMLELI